MFRNPLAAKNLPEVNVAETLAALTTGTHQIIDVRERDEWDAYRIAGTSLIPLGDLARRANELDPTLPVITVCKSGIRSLVAIEILQAAGRNDVASLAGGVVAWYEAGNQLEQ